MYLSKYVTRLQKPEWEKNLVFHLPVTKKRKLKELFFKFKLQTVFSPIQGSVLNEKPGFHEEQENCALMKTEKLVQFQSKILIPVSCHEKILNLATGLGNFNRVLLRFS